VLQRSRRNQENNLAAIDPETAEAAADTERRSDRRQYDPEPGRPRTTPQDLSSPALLVNRETSQLCFFQRVLEEAQDETVPVLERVKFLSILGSIMSEFFMVRVAGLKQQVAAGVTTHSPDGLTPSDQLAAIRPMVQKLMDESRACLNQALVKLEEAGMRIVDYEMLNDAQKDRARSYFQDSIFPVLTPLAYDPARPFPFISNMSLNLAVIVRDEDGKERFARVKVPSTLPRLIPVSAEIDVAKPAIGARRMRPGPKDGGLPPSHDQGVCLVWLEQVVAAYLAELFPGLQIVDTHVFRVTRDADIEIQELEAGDLLETVEHLVRRRRFGSVVRLVIDHGMPEYIQSILTKNLRISQEDVYQVDLPLAMSNLGSLYGFGRPDLKDPSFVPRDPLGLEQAEGAHIFAAIRRGDILLHHPYESFEPVVEFLETAASDPDVLAIKQTLYRVGRNSPVVAALMEAARNGKEVAVLVELKARFDEESNIEWARALEREGVHVVYGPPKIKVHSKTTLVVRREGNTIRRYVHLSTGNYNAVTATQYTDIGLFTCNEEFGEDASDLFNYLTGYSKHDEYRKLIVAPLNMRRRVEAMIQREIDLAKRGTEARLIFKINSLVDPKMIALLYKASQAGVKCDLLVRGICCLRPGLPGISDNVRVTSIVGRFLEHSRIYYFLNGGSEECYLGSADLMPRNLNRRVEILFPVEDPTLCRRLRDEILETYMRDNVKARLMLSDGRYERVHPSPGEQAVNSQEWFISNAPGHGEKVL
jgi:polyphosphate kinase